MSSQLAQKPRRTSSSPMGAAAKAGSLLGPIKATQVFTLSATTAGSLVYEGQANPKSKRSSSDRLQFGSPNRERKYGSDGTSGIRKSKSVDAVTSSCYLNGVWPRPDPLVAQAYFCPSNLTLDQATQTPQEWCHVRASKTLKSEVSGRPASIASADGLKTFRACLTRSNRESGRHSVSGSSQTNSTLLCHSGFSPISLALPSKPMAVPDLHRNRTPVYGSPDSLSQEIEKFAMSGTNSFSAQAKLSPDGRCAPVAEHLKTCSAVTQTPSQFAILKDMNGSIENLLLAPDSDLLGLDCFDFKGSPEELLRFASPQPLSNRLAPEGCEKVCGKFQEINKAGEPKVEPVPPVKLPSSICHIPSESSAFNPPLVANYLNQPNRMAKKMSNSGI